MAFRNLFNFRQIRNFRMSSKLRTEEALKELKDKNPFFDKYAEKIAKLQATSPEELLSRLEVKEMKEKQSKETRDYSELMNPKKSVEKPASSDVPVKKLDDIMKVDLIKDKSPDEIKQIWYEYHKDKDVIAAMIPIEKYNMMMERAKLYPLFLFPVPRSQGYEFIMFQFSANTVHFTPLLCYQVHKENAPECLNIVHYTEFKDKGLILMRGEFDSKVITSKEAQCLANQLQMYYTQDSKEKIMLLEQFTKTPDQFKHMEVIKELESLELK